MGTTMKFEITERIPEPVPEKSVNLTLTTEELGLIVFAMKIVYDKYSHSSEAIHLTNDLAYIEGVSSGQSI